MQYPMSSPNQRKRPAPGTSPSIAMQPIDQQFGSTDSMMRWTSPDNSGGFVEDASQGMGSYGLQQIPAQFQQPVPATPSNMLTRRTMNRALIPTGPRANFDTNGDPWTSLVPADPSTLDPTVGSELSEQENLQHLEQLALKAKRDAEAKRKQIPPFVQKLSSFLNEGKNQDLIKWSEKGDSFIVVDEEEFAKKLIPELFKHNNYASFVRQLNMYGFHKRVGLSDNSMRASERKNKSPSEYSNPYFRRGHPNLLWLITKPKSSSKAKKSSKSTDPEVDSDEEAGSPTGQSAYPPVPQNMSLSETNSALKKKELALIRDEFKKIREHQQVILSRMQRLEQNQQRIEQQQRAQQQKDQRVDEIYRLFMRHETSLQSMMQILVYHFKKTLEDNKSAQQIKDIMSTGFLPGNHGSHGIVELDDYIQKQPKSPSPMGVVPKRARGLLEAPPLPQAGNVRTVPVSPASAQGFSAPEMGSVTEILDPSPADTATPYLPADLSPNSQEKLMQMLHDASASAAAASSIPNTNSSASQAHLAQPVPQTTRRANPQPTPGVAHSSTSTTPTMSMPPVSGAAANIPVSAAAAPAIPPVTAPPSVPPSSSISPEFSQFNGAAPGTSQYAALSSIPASLEPGMNMSAKEYDNLKKLQAAQDHQIQLLGSKLAPLSPSGQLPGFGGPGDGSEYFPNTNFDLNDPTFNEFINSDPFTGDGNDLANATLPADDFGHDFDFSLLDHQDGTGAHVDANNAPSPSGTEEILRDDLGAVDSPDRGSKRRKIQ
ncbi:hypothetical protein jhhlp_001466 [Lomentospora prolificans]|uniref:HSF-type DNA-binding domain-containing protein n=1 Tax=Lomentospora prolificans TaxID=41688 RepID=A0A2N3NIB9_9PEZI|nr:hypothetical protein jhhlp_001466 [Lomentospora prolificans]